MQAGEFFHRSLDLGETLDNVARLAVQSFADLCIFDLIDERSERIYVTSAAHRDASVAPLVKSVASLIYNAEFRSHPVLSVTETGTPFFLPEIDEQNIAEYAASRDHEEYMRALGYRSKIVVPVSTRGRIFGALTFVMTGDQRFDTDDLQFARELGRRAGLAVENAKLFARERNVARGLQQAFLTRTFPQSEALRFYALYRPCDSEADLGGDWYDAFATKSGAIVVTIGHVAGRGFETARTMVQLREAIRIASLLTERPGEILALANEALLLESCDTPASAFVGVIEPETLAARYACAGHVAPMVRRRNGAVERLDAPSARLAIPEAAPFEERSVVLTPGSLFVLFTAGGDETAMQAAVASDGFIHAADPARYLERVVRGASDPDDFAVLVVEAPDRPRWRFDAGDARVAYGLKDDFLREIAALSGAGSDLEACRLIFAELIGNSARHAPGPLSIALEVDDGLTLHFIDDGPGFDYDPKLPVDVWAESGRGLFLISQLAPEVSVTRLPLAGSHVAVKLPVSPDSRPAA